MNIYKLKSKLKKFKKDINILLAALKHPDNPIYAKLVIIIPILYVLSPIDLIPDFIPILGLLDDFILIPASISLATKLIPKDVMEECKKDQTTFYDIKNVIITSFITLILVWILIIYLLLYKLVK